MAECVTKRTEARLMDTNPVTNGLVHILKHGLTLCGIPCPELPEGDRWVSFQDEPNLAYVTCPDCRKHRPVTG